MFIVRAEPLPHVLFAVTDRTPLVVADNEMLVPEPEGVPPPEYDQVYEVAPLTELML